MRRMNLFANRRSPGCHSGASEAHQIIIFATEGGWVPVVLLRSSPVPMGNLVKHLPGLDPQGVLTL